MRSGSPRSTLAPFAARAFVAATVSLLAVACLVDVPPLVTPSDAGGLDASTPETSAADATTADVAIACAAGAFAAPLRVFDANPTAKGDFCNLDGVTVKGDGKITGLDRGDSTLNVAVTTGHPETTCVGIEIAARPLSEIVVTAASAALGCDVRCTDGDGCDSHQWADVFVAPASGAWIFLERIDTTRTLADFVVAVPATLQELTMIAVCRGDGGKNRDDQVVDFIGPRCR